MRSCRFGIENSTRLAAVLMGLLLLLALPSAGCSSKTPEEAKKELEKLKKKEKPKPPFDHLRVITEPNAVDPKIAERKPKKDKDEPDINVKPAKEEDEEPQLITRAVKPGHWTGVLLEAKANTSDFSGDLSSTARDAQSNLVDLEGTPFRLATSRAATLPKGQKKTLETLFFPPRGRTNIWIYNQLHNRQHGGEEFSEPELLPHMPAYQYYLFVLSRDPNRYRYLKVLDSVRPTAEMSNTTAEAVSYYRVLTPRPIAPLALPTRSVCWTSLAIVVWDDVLPTVLLPEQQQAMLDWLHWGGGLIISGPQTLDALRGSFLEPYLPATAADVTSFDANSLVELNQNWAISDGDNRPLLTPAQPWPGVTLNRHPEAEFLPGTGELVAERRVGRGRIVVTAFRLSERELLAWRSFDSFFNACLLRRPPRSFGRDQFDYVQPSGSSFMDRFDPALASNVRFFTRDTPESPSYEVKPPAKPVLAMANSPRVLNARANVNYDVADVDYLDPLADTVELSKTNSGVAGWNDFSEASSAARAALREAAGIAVPKREFVFWMVGIYLLAVAPLNWLVFRAMRRVEWAWIAVPFLALGWGLAVIWLAQLDIGFARSETEIGVLELQNGFPRAHLTRYTALYTSLSTSYNVHFEDRSAVALPFSTNVQLLQNQARTTVTLRNFSDSELTDYPVSSNSTGMVHSEQMVNLGGGVAWQSSSPDGPTITNQTNLELSGAALIRRRQVGDALAVDESAWIGDLAPGQTAAVQFRPHLEVDERLLAERERSPVTRLSRLEGALNIRRLIDVAQDHKLLAPGEVRLVAWLDRGTPGIQVEPAASQVRKATLVVAHLGFGLPTAKPDLNLRSVTVPSDPAQ